MCTFCLVMGESMIAFVMGGITANMNLIELKFKQLINQREFVYFSLSIHHDIPQQLIGQVMQYMREIEDDVIS